MNGKEALKLIQNKTVWDYDRFPRMTDSATPELPDDSDEPNFDDDDWGFDEADFEWDDTDE